VILGKYHKLPAGPVFGRVAVRPAPETRVLTGINKTFFKGLYQVFYIAEIDVIAVSLAGKQRMEAMMEIIAPNRVKSVTPVLFRIYKLGIV
jgi:hypothetical protein